MPDIAHELHRLKRRIRRITSSGSPFRYLYKWQDYLVRPASHLRRRKEAQALTKKLTPEFAAHVQRLRTTGFSPAEAELDQALLQELSEFAAARTAPGTLELNREQVRSFFNRLNNEKDLASTGIMVRFALQPNVVAIASAYLGEVPYLSCVQIIESFHNGKDRWEESQLWHRDHEDSRTVKLWIYLSDVTSPDVGPFTYLPLPYSDRVKDNFYPGRIDDQRMASFGVLDEAKAVVGPRLTSFYIDSSRCYHLGSRVAPGPSRIIYEATFVTQAPLFRLDSGIQVEEPVSPLHALVLRR